MLTGKELGAAIGKAIEKKKITKAELARHFEIKPPSVSDWVKRGTIDKAKLEKLFSYFADVVGPEHWGIKTSPPYMVQSPQPPEYEVRRQHSRKLVQTVCELAEQINDNGLRELIGFARCLTGTHPAAKQTPASSA